LGELMAAKGETWHLSWGGDPVTGVFVQSRDVYHSKEINKKKKKEGKSAFRKKGGEKGPVRF